MTQARVVKKGKRPVKGSLTQDRANRVVSLMILTFFHMILEVNTPILNPNLKPPEQTVMRCQMTIPENGHQLKHRKNRLFCETHHTQTRNAISFLFLSQRCIKILWKRLWLLHLQTSNFRTKRSMMSSRLWKKRGPRLGSSIHLMTSKRYFCTLFLRSSEIGVVKQRIWIPGLLLAGISKCLNDTAKRYTQQWLISQFVS